MTFAQWLNKVEEHARQTSGTQVRIKFPDPDAGCDGVMEHGGMECSLIRVAGTTEPRWIDNTLFEITEQDDGNK